MGLFRKKKVLDLTYPKTAAKIIGKNIELRKKKAQKKLFNKSP